MTTSRDCWALVCNSSGEPLVGPENPEFLVQTFSFEFEVGAPTSEAEIEKKKKRSTKSPLTSFLESCLLYIPYRRFPIRLVANFFSFCR